MDQAEVAAVLDEIAVLLELQDPKNRFRPLAYSRAARIIAQLDTNLNELVESGKLGEVPGIGSGLTEKISTLVTTGALPYWEELKAKTPSGLRQMLRLPGLGPKKVKLLFDELGIDDLAKLQEACTTDKVAHLKGFGAKTQAKILEGLAFLSQLGNRIRLDQAQAVADALVAGLRQCAGILRLEVCGSLRRRKETINDIDLLVSATDAGPIMDAFVQLPQVQKIVGRGDTKSSVLVAGIDDDNRRLAINADLRVVTPAQFPFALNYFTGSKDHNVAMRQRAIQYGLKLNEYELAGPKKSIACKDEEDIYRALDLDYIAPELREDRGEIAAAAEHKLPRLVTADALCGVFHCHTTWSDGAATLEEMAAAAKQRGYQYLGIADHSQSLTIANGLTPARVAKQQRDIDALNAKLRGIHLFKGTECDILADGALDYDDKVLAKFDYIVASVHSHFNQSEEEMTRRIVKAISHPRVTMLGHATGRLLLQRDGYKLDLEAVLQAAREHGVMIEINANPRRLDLDWIHCKRAKALGVQLVINPDAHSTDEFDFTSRFGIDVARRGWLEKEDVFNTRELAEVKKALADRISR
ncbi:MAG: DNA polymerase/3'-5' exonuclease PolX [Gemmataceae bacterium]|nr:DNA polymerase/3'-5' exonuclease PolX [Gemmataceae bacterium]